MESRFATGGNGAYVWRKTKCTANTQYTMNRERESEKRRPPSAVSKIRGLCVKWETWNASRIATLEWRRCQRWRRRRPRRRRRLRPNHKSSNCMGIKRLISCAGILFFSHSHSHSFISFFHVFVSILSARIFSSNAIRERCASLSLCVCAAAGWVCR